jgi:hypothetical protein
MKQLRSNNAFERTVRHGGPRGNRIEYESPERFAADLREKFKKNGELVKALGPSK